MRVHDQRIQSGLGCGIADRRLGARFMVRRKREDVLGPRCEILAGRAAAGYQISHANWRLRRASAAWTVRTPTGKRPRAKGSYSFMTDASWSERRARARSIQPALRAGPSPTTRAPHDYTRHVTDGSDRHPHDS